MTSISSPFMNDFCKQDKILASYLAHYGRYLHLPTCMYQSGYDLKVKVNR